ncbi:MAG: 4Fe-4S dicluster domain-containing protein [Anaerolineae bacterium]|nr:4Fe-4S dicluster domain-containing protein [Anaerolineae bacterium]
MTHVITSLCLREGSCVAVCPVECIIPGIPADKYPTFYIDEKTCIDCGACVAECPFGAIFPKKEVPTVYIALEGQRQVKPVGTPGFTEIFDGMDVEHNPVHLTSTRSLSPGEELDLTPDIQDNIDFFINGPGYKSLS